MTSERTGTNTEAWHQMLDEAVKEAERIERDAYAANPYHVHRLARLVLKLAEEYGGAP